MRDVTRLRLDNGLTVLAQPSAAAPVVACQAWVGVGAADEQAPLLGVAHLHEHMLFKGTARQPVGGLARSVEAAGGEINAWTSFDQTVYHVVLGRDELGVGIDVLADALRNASFDPEELRREIEVVLEEIRRAADAPARRLSNAVFELAYAGHPYARPVLGSRASVSAMSRDQIVGFYRQWYRPDNVTLVVVGDFELAALTDLVQQHLGDWEATGPLRRAPRPAPPRLPLGPPRLLVEDVQEANVALAWPGPGLTDPDVAAADALAVILGHGDASRLYDAVCRRRSLVNDVYAYAYTPRCPGLFMVGAGMRPDRVEAACQAVCEVVAALRDADVGASELERAQALVLADSARQQETVQGQARKLGSFELEAGDHAFEGAYLEAVRGLTPAALRAVAGRLLEGVPALVAQVPQSSATSAAALEAACARALRPPSARRPAVRGRAHGRLEVERLELENGAVLLLRREPGRQVALRAVALGGQRWEDAGCAGHTNLFAHVWGLRTERHAPAALADAVARLGGTLGAFAGRNSVGLRADFIAERAAAGMQLFAEVLATPQFEAAEVERERAVLLERIANRHDQPSAVAFEAFAAAVHPQHPYGLPTLGTAESLGRCDAAHCRALWERFVGPDRLVLAVVGDVEANAVLDLLGPALERPPGPPLPPPPPAAAPTAAPRRQHLALQRQQSHLVIGGRGSTLAAPDRFALEVMTTVLGGQGGRLFLDLRDRQSLAYSVACGSVEGLDPGHVYVYIGVGPDKVGQARDGVLAHLERLRAQPVAADELQRARAYLCGSHAIELQRAGSRATAMALNERYGLGYAAHLDYPAAIAAVDAAAVQALARTYFDPGRLHEVVVGPPTS